jgi:outer membrane usher protein
VVALESTSAIVGDDGEVYLTGLSGKTTFSVQWGEESDRQCHGELDLPSQGSAGIVKATVNCH